MPGSAEVARAAMFGKRADMIVRGELPFNAEPPPSVLASSEITPVDAFYARNHGPIPDVAVEQWQLTVEGLVDRSLTVTYEELTRSFPQHWVVATLSCAGNRRAELLKFHPIPGKDPWAHGAISTAEWRGARLADVLEAAGVQRDADLHVAFDAPDVAQEARPVQSYGSSIPLKKAMSEEVLLVWQMNGRPLPPVHGGPVRVVVPGYIGARSVKWITGITVQAAPSQNYFQALDYRILPPEADANTVAPGEGIALSTLALNCDILVPTDSDAVPAGSLNVHGYAIAGDGRSVERLDVSVDEGRTWRQADLQPPRSQWAWRLWSITVEVERGPLVLSARAWDNTGAVQPDTPGPLWNPRGYVNDSWARIELEVI